MNNEDSYVYRDPELMKLIKKSIMQTTWNWFSDREPPAGISFVALFGDGSGSEVFARLDNGEYMDARGHEIKNDTFFDSFSLWAELPAGFKLFNEE